MSMPMRNGVPVRRMNSIVGYIMRPAVERYRQLSCGARATFLRGRAFGGYRSIDVANAKLFHGQL
jgi:hypothetical protein